MKDELIKYGIKTVTRTMLLQMYASMLKIRMFEEKIVELYPEQEMKCPVHLCIGQEAIAAGVCLNLRKEDYVFSNHRGHGHTIAKGGALRPLMAEFYGKKTGCSKGKGGSMHIIDVDNGILGTSAIVGGGIPMGVGAALSSALRKQDRVTVIFFGDGAYDEGVFYESFNFASLKKLPVVFFCENNFYATNSHQSARQPGCRISDTASAFDARGTCIDGNDVLSVYKESQDAIARARRGGGPSLIEAKTYRWKGHVGPEADYEKGCRPKEELFYWIERCPIKRFKELLLRKDVATVKELDEIAAKLSAEIEDSVDFAKKSEYPELSELLTDVYYTGGGVPKENN
ncbi:MAG: thiamine pyrophosphate-dependent dehydrogenase E1 component subunit alpha [Deltaproteobacteria bacterium]|nr:thiamine pyrophosphate-dependent dehydrogenase E1 component subunit alpha [Deltaproteobacteria bacterium]